MLFLFSLDEFKKCIAISELLEDRILKEKEMNKEEHLDLADAYKYRSLSYKGIGKY